MDRFDIRRLDIDMEIDLSQTMDIIGRLVEEMIDKVDIGLEDLDGELTKRICGNRDVWVLIILWGI